MAALTTIVVVTLGAALWRELNLDRMYAAIPGAPTGDLVAMQARLATIDTMIDRNPLWIGMFDAGRERSQLRTDIDRLEAARAANERKLALERARIETLANAERTRAQLLAEQSDFNQALSHLQLSLQYAPPEWEHRDQVQRDIASIVAWQRKTPQTAQAARK